MKPEQLVGQILAGRYRITELIGSGGMAMVFKAEQRELERFAAVKIMHSSLIQDKDSCARFEREAQSLSLLEHKNIAMFYAYGLIEPATFPGANDRTIPYMVMEYLNGKSLRDVLNQEQCLPWERALRIIEQCCAGMEYAHNHQVVHRDIKPNNIMLVDVPLPAFVKIVDFGLAKAIVPPGADAQKLTQTGALIGSVAYMSPEQCEGKAADKRSDIYALGCVLYELLTGEAPLQADNPIGLMHKHVNEVPMSLSGKMVKETLPVGLEECLFKALEKDPDKRYQTMGQFKSDLELVGQGQGSLTQAASGGHVGVSRRVDSWKPSARMLKGLLVVLAFCVGAFLLYAVTDNGIISLSEVVWKGSGSSEKERTVAALGMIEGLERLGRRSAFQRLRDNFVGFIDALPGADLNRAGTYLRLAQMAARHGESKLAFELAEKSIRQTLTCMDADEALKSGDRQRRVEALLNDSAKIVSASGGKLHGQTMSFLVGKRSAVIVPKLEHCDKFLELARASLPHLRRHLRVNLELSMELACAYAKSGKIDLSLQVYRTLLMDIESEFGIDCPQAVWLKCRESRVLAEAGAYKEALALLMSCSRIVPSARLIAPENLDLWCAAIKDACLTAAILRRPVLEIEWLKRGCVILSERGNPGSTMVGQYFWDLADVYAKNGMSQEAFDYYLKALKLAEKRLPENAVQPLWITAGAAGNLSETMDEKKTRYFAGKALDYMNKYASAKIKLKIDDLDLAGQCSNTLRHTYRNLNDSRNEIVVARLSDRLVRQTKSEDDEIVIRASLELMESYAHAGMTQESLMTYKRVLASVEKRYGKGGPYAVLIKCYEADCLATYGERQSAEQLLNESWGVLLKDGYPPGEKVRLCRALFYARSACALLFLDKRQLECAQRLWDLAHQSNQSTLIDLAAQNLIEAQMNVVPEKAPATAKAYLDLMLKRYPFNDPAVLYARSLYFRSLTRSGQFEVARREYARQLVELSEKSLGNPKDLIDYYRISPDYACAGYFPEAKKINDAGFAALRAFGLRNDRAEYGMLEALSRIVYFEERIDETKKCFSKMQILAEDSDSVQNHIKDSLWSCEVFHGALKDSGRLGRLPEAGNKVFSFHQSLEHSFWLSVIAGDVVSSDRLLERLSTLLPAEFSNPYFSLLPMRTKNAALKNNLALAEKCQREYLRWHKRTYPEAVTDACREELFLCTLLSRQGRGAEADVLSASVLAKVRNVYPQSALLALLSGQYREAVLIENGRYAEAATLCHELIARYEGQISQPIETDLLMANHIMLAYALSKHKRAAEARPEIDKITAWIKPESCIWMLADNAALLSLAEAEQGAGRFAEAKKLANLLLNDRGNLSCQDPSIAAKASQLLPELRRK